MKKSIFTLTILLSFANNSNANQIIPEKNNITDNEIAYIVEEETDEAFSFNHKTYLPENFNPYDLTDNEADVTLWIDEDEDEAFDFDHTQYLPVGFNPNSAFNALFLEDLEWIEEEDEPFTFDTNKYFNNHKEEILDTNNF
ncbi:MAG: hypothetical protein HQ471_10495 [Flavobacteriales bacterium]|mgnify:CR=1 FL=1|jgi:hypothetical protein|nr:hypothetical protein [Flavobacteriales bacterium]